MRIGFFQCLSLIRKTRHRFSVRSRLSGQTDSIWRDRDRVAGHHGRGRM